MAGRVGGSFDGKEVVIKLFSKSYSISGAEIAGETGARPAFDQCVILSKYLILAPAYPPSRRDWVKYRDLKDSGPLIGYFSKETEDAIAGEFTGNPQSLKDAGLKLGGFVPDLDARYDVAMQFTALPEMPLVMLFNDADDEFPAECSVLFQRCAEAYLDAECLAMPGGLLFRLLKNRAG